MDHVRKADERRAAIYRQMTPTRRLQQAVRLNRQMRSLMDAGLRAQHPDWYEAERRRGIAERILHARTE
ncbi:MAG: hypothetical protein A3G75_02920 [Verrucomicrobia bacterium RIFCSPLOWO2_12_FULL_64_8]|nr:MAG: hypothetical protein A3G75_02920 [Verrucomicrobia bacterium RIFCSPLOWO2_12_FULL_64_8]